MSEDVENEEEREEEVEQPKRRRFGRVLPSSLEGRASCLLSLFLFVLVVTAWTVFWFDTSNVPWYHAMGWGKIAAIIVLMIVIPILFYRAIRLWLQGDTSQFPDIDYAWNAGLEALEAHGLSLDSAPLFLILGSSGQSQERAVINASGQEMRVAHIPEGPSPLHWYANPDGIFLFCSEASWLSSLAALWEERTLHEDSEPSGSDSPPEPLAAPQVAQPEVDPLFGAPLGQEPTAPRAPAPDPSAAGSDEQQIRGTIMLDQFVSQGGQGGPSGTDLPLAEPARADAADPDAIRGTLMLSQPVESVPMQGEEEDDEDVTAPVTEENKPAIVPAQEANAQLRRLRYVCQLIRTERGAICGANGVITMLPFEAIQAGPSESEELQRAIRSDTLTIQRSLQLRCPVTALVVGMEKERGFRELVRRVGRERSFAQRFGRKYDVHCIPTPEEMVALSSHVCGAFEDWGYTLFREKNALTRPGNLRLYGLLCKVRCNLKTRLAEIMRGGFAYDPQRSQLDEPTEFSGCYFAATGRTPDRQAFVKGVFDKLLEEQEEVEWTRQALTDHKWNQRLARLGLAADVALLGALAYMMISRQFR